MNDRFRYRVWDKENKCLHYPTRYNNFSIVNGTVVKIESYPTANSAYLGKRIAWEFDDAVIMQCTGLKDKNGKLIYEGDILKDKNGALHPIRWNVKGFYEADTFAVAGFYNAIQEDMEVIGNKFENSELLKECKNE